MLCWAFALGHVIIAANENTPVSRRFRITFVVMIFGTILPLLALWASLRPRPSLLDGATPIYGGYTNRTPEQG